MSEEDSDVTLDQLLAPVLRVARPNLIGLCEPDLSFVSDRLKRGLATVHDRLREEVGGLVGLRSGYGDLIVCRIAAGQQPIENDKLAPDQHLRRVWSHFVALRATFDRYLDDVHRCHREALDLFALDIEPINPPQRRLPDQDDASRWIRLDRWYEVAPGRQAAIAETTVASQWSESLPAFVGSLDAARDDLIWAIDAEIKWAGSAIANFLTLHGDTLVDLIERYNDMVWNFQRLRRRGLN